MDSPDSRPVGEVLVVDAANVVGSRPDGWWKDRAGAAARLHGRLVRAADLGLRVVLVLEGQARAGVPAGTVDGVEVVHAFGSGDDAIVEVVRRLTEQSVGSVVVTADRGLIALVEELGSATRRPGWLLDWLPD